MRQFVKADPHQVESPQPSAEAPVDEASPIVLVLRAEAVPVPPQHAPPDLASLLSSFRI
jgi:hypothetical protein